MTSQPTITVVGSIMTDMISYVPRLPGPGETLIGGRFEIGFGGKGANQAVMARRLGASVRMIACVGRDAFGDQAVENLVAQGIDAQSVYRSGAATGVAPIWVEADGTNRIAVIPGANDDMDPGHVAKTVLAQSSEVVIGQLEVPQPVTLAAFGAARGAGSVTILNPAPAAEIDPGAPGCDGLAYPERDRVRVPRVIAAEHRGRLGCRRRRSGPRLEHLTSPARDAR